MHTDNDQCIGFGKFCRIWQIQIISTISKSKSNYFVKNFKSNQIKKRANPNQSEIDLILAKSKSFKSNPLQNNDKICLHNKNFFLKFKTSGNFAERKALAKSDLWWPLSKLLLMIWFNFDDILRRIQIKSLPFPKFRNLIKILKFFGFDLDLSDLMAPNPMHWLVAQRLSARCIRRARTQTSLLF